MLPGQAWGTGLGTKASISEAGKHSHITDVETEAQLWAPNSTLPVSSPVAHMVKNPPAMQETRVQSLGWEDSPGEGNSYPLQYSCLEKSMDEELGGLQSTGSQRVGHD